MSQLHIAHFTNTYLPVTSGVVRSVAASGGRWSIWAI
jgi:hypothetical protein